MQEVYQYIENINREIIGRLDGENKRTLQRNTGLERKDHYFDKPCTFAPNQPQGI